MVTFGEISWERMIGAVGKVRLRLQKTVAVLNEAHIDYALVGGNAVAAWVSRVDEASVRNTRDVYILIRRSDLPAAIIAMEATGFVYRHAAGIDVFLDGPDAKSRDAVHIVFANEKVRQEYALPTPGVDEVIIFEEAKYLTLEALTRMELTKFTIESRVHLCDMIEVGLIDVTWPHRFQAPLNQRLQELLDNPDG